jgi:hypothetical protein
MSAIGAQIGDAPFVLVLVIDKFCMLTRDERLVGIQNITVTPVFK